MGLFSNLKTEGLEKAEDRLGGFQLFDTDVYEGKVKVAYAGKSTGGAMNVSVVYDLGGKEYRETYWITNSKGENFFMAKDKDQKETGKKSPLPGFTIVNDLCLMTTDKPLAEQDTEEKVLKIWDPEEKKELPKGVQVLTDLTDKPIFVGVLKQTVNKQVKGDDNQYVDTADSRDENVTDKVYHHPTGLTVSEAERGLTEGEFIKAWTEKNKGVTRDRRRIKDGQANGQNGKAGRPGGPPQASGSGAAKPTTSLFGKS